MGFHFIQVSGLSSTLKNGLVTVLKSVAFKYLEEWDLGPLGDALKLVDVLREGLGESPQGVLVDVPHLGRLVLLHQDCVQVNVLGQERLDRRLEGATLWYKQPSQLHCVSKKKLHLEKVLC